jgi:glyoxylase-like metal-dependent hydrolase (beta-lactamase superfamily II)
MRGMDTMYGMRLPDVERWSERVGVVRGLNPGLFTGPGTNTYLVGTGRRPILIDTGADREGYIPLLEQALRDLCDTDTPGEIVVTHVHPDHIGGAVSIVEHFGPLSVSKKPWPGRDEAFEVELTPLDDGALIRTEGATLRAIHTPGHAPDHLCFYLEEESALFTGDVVLGAGTSVIPTDGGNMTLYLETLEKLLNLKAERICPGHGPAIDDPQAKLREYIDHRLERERAIVAAVREGARTVDQVVERVYADTPRPLWPAAGMSVLSHLLKLERERRAARAVDAAGEEHWALA